MKNVRVAFFTEAGHSRGMGHLIRSFVISEKLKSLGVETFFFLDSNIFFNGKFKEITYFDWGKFDISNNYDIIFIDSYEADIGVYQQISNACKVAVYVDDFKRLDYPKGVILNFAPDAGELFYKDKEERLHYLLGLKYLPLRDGFVNASKSIQVGIRGNTRTLDWLDSSYELGYEIITKDNFDEFGVDKCIEMIQERVGDAPIYITFDLDCLDVTVAPGVSNLEPAIEGFKMPDVLKMLQGLRGKNIIGGDVVCLMPTVDSPNQITSHVANSIMFEMVCLIADNVGNES